MVMIMVMVTAMDMDMGMSTSMEEDAVMGMIIAIIMGITIRMKACR